MPEHPRNLGFSEKGQSLISAYNSLAITPSTSGFEKLSMALNNDKKYGFMRLMLMLSNLKTQNLSLEELIIRTNDGKVWLPFSNVQLFEFFVKENEKHVIFLFLFLLNDSLSHDNLSFLLR